jgi:pSer/pThr/pTyr-binding forkhead associated (FHA) protein
VAQRRVGGDDTIVSVAHLDIPAVEGDQGARTVPLTGELVRLGRAAENDIVIIDATLSRQHCELFALGGGGWGVRDSGSGNGVVIDDKRITGDSELADGDALVLGGVTVVYRESTDDAPDLFDADDIVIDDDGEIQLDF